jgi:hypothetical protein
MLLILAASQLVQAAQPVNKDEQIYADAMALGKQQKKYVFIMFTSNSCHWCDELKRKTFQNPTTKATLDQYVRTEINISKDGYGLMKRTLAGYKNHAFGKTWSGQVPVYFLINPYTNTSVGQKMGYTSSTGLTAWLRTIKQQGNK